MVRFWGFRVIETKDGPAIVSVEEAQIKPVQALIVVEPTATASAVP